MSHLAFNLHPVATLRIGQHRDAGFIFVAQRQMERQINVARQAQLVQSLLGRCFWPRFRRYLGSCADGCNTCVSRNFDGGWHGTIVPV